MLRRWGAQDHQQQARPHHLGFHGHGGVVHDGCGGGWKLRGPVIAPRCIFVFCISVICAAYCCVLHANGGLVCDESPVFLGLRFTRKIVSDIPKNVPFAFAINNRNTRKIDGFDH